MKGVKLPRKVSDNASVAYFDHKDLVDEPGFYVVEQEAQENDGKLELGKRVYVDDRADVDPENRETGFFHEPFGGSDEG